MKHLLLALSLVFALMLSGCYTAPVMPPQGLVYTETTAPLDIGADETNLDNLEQGSASHISILGLIAVGDCSVAEAARNGNLKKVNHLDYSYTNILFIYQNFTTIAYGTSDD
jgi:TRL-like protein family